MARIVLYGWKPGLKKVGLTLFLRNKAGYPLAKAKEITDAVLGHKRVAIEIPAVVFESVRAELTALGVEFVVDDDLQRQASKES